MTMTYLIKSFFFLISILWSFRWLILRLIQSTIAGEKKGECYILTKLSPDLLFAVIDHLRPHSQRLLFETCSQMRCLSRIYPKTYRDKLSRREHREYLMILSRDLPEQWACEHCPALHPISEHDTAQDVLRRGMTCPRYDHLDSRCCPSYLPAHRHVQIALKYQRLGLDNLTPKQYQHLQALLRPQVLNKRPFVSGCSNFLEYRRICPKIAKGRFLLKIAWKYMCGECESSIDIWWLSNRLELCNHQRQLQSALVPLKTSHRVLRKAFLNTGVEVLGGCPYCPTDFTIQRWKRQVLVCAWVDMGAEGSMSSRSWRIHGPFNLPWSIYHEPGTVKDLYEGGQDSDFDADKAYKFRQIPDEIHTRIFW